MDISYMYKFIYFIFSTKNTSPSLRFFDNRVCVCTRDRSLVCSTALFSFSVVVFSIPLSLAFSILLPLCLTFCPVSFFRFVYFSLSPCVVVVVSVLYTQRARERKNYNNNKKNMPTTITRTKKNTQIHTHRERITHKSLSYLNFCC